MATIANPPCTTATIASASAQRCASRAATWVLAAAILGSSMAFIDGTAVSVALPALQVDLGASIAGEQWVVEAYALLLAALVLTGGSLGDIYGRRRIFAVGVAVFAAASAWCGLAPNLAQLILARGVQGVGAALLVPGSLALISVAFLPAARGRAIGTWSGFTSVTAAIGPVLGGWLVQHLSWRWVFFVNLPLAAAVLALVFTGVPESRAAGEPPRPDWPGSLLASTGLGSITFALIEAHRHRLWAGLAGAAGIALLTAFVLVEVRAAAPLLPLDLFHPRSPGMGAFSAANLITFFLYAGLGGVLFFFPLNLIQVQGYTATAAGAALLPFILLMFLLSRWSGGLVQRYGARAPLVAGPAIVAAGFLLFAQPGVGGTYWATFFPAVVVLGLGMAISVAPLTTTVMDAAGPERAGAASGVNNAVSRLASLLAVAGLGWVLMEVFTRTLSARLGLVPLSTATRQAILAQRDQLGAIATGNPLVQAAVGAAFVSGFRAILVIAAGLALASALVAALALNANAAHLR
ncbi:MAG TPA: MFS transporter [Terriglobales bacterium]|jgi:EmrB/QacA subfamily drug resistance transporter